MTECCRLWIWARAPGEVHGVEPICKGLPVAPSTYRTHVAWDRSRQAVGCAKRDAKLKIEVRRVFKQNFGVYGARKVAAGEARRLDDARCTVERLMQTVGLHGVA